MATVVSGMRSTTDLSTYRLVVDIADGISLLNPNENPFTLLSKKVSKVEAKQPKHSWLEDVLQPETDSLGSGTAYASGVTAMIVNDYTKFTTGDLWMNWRTYEVMKVKTTSTTSTTAIEFVRNYPAVASTKTGYNVACAASEPLVRIGNVNEEGATAPTARTTQETQQDNYTQIIRTPFYLTETEINSLQYGEQDLPYQTRKKGIEHAREIEYALLFGLPGTPTGTNSRPARTTGGIWYYIKEGAPAANVVSATTLDSATFLAWLRAGFRYGSAKKVMFAPPLILSALESWGFVKLLARPTDTTFGINITNWVSPHGEVAIINHKMLEGPNPGTAGAFTFLLDMQNIQYTYLRNRDTKLRTGIQAPDADAYMAEYLTECSIKIKLPATHAAIYGTTGFSA